MQNNYLIIIWIYGDSYYNKVTNMTNKLEYQKLIVQMLKRDYKIIKKLAVDKDITLKRLVIDALSEYVNRNTKI